ncbi:YhgE/Pip domain-containing protein [Acetivibrio cellulolyticus]|uniref:YhgE/Pip domain-containing protein n=1 Tax=Acetivibrio cellulolyticus TaxID=35830 RepID=UPI0001E2D4F4|nr:YhgE/Pip domain-containing protein [Acetivibrio cellulolyticus]
MDKTKYKELAESRKTKSRFAMFKIIKDDLKFFKNNTLKMVGIIVICFIPLLYSCLYLDAFWNPYGNLDKLPIAVVNMDKGSLKDGDSVNFGNEVIESLKDNKSLKWVFTNYDDAQYGVKKDKYYSMVVIPENFSKTVTDSVNGNMKQASITYIPNEKKNYLASQISSRVMLELKEKVASSISDNGTKVLVESLYDAKDGFKKAYDGSAELNDGAGKLYDGAKKLDSTMDELISGADLLKDGSGKLLDGLKEFQNQSNDGKSKLISGAKDLSTGTGKAYDGIKVYDEKISKGENELADGAKKLSDGLDTFANGLDEYDSKIKDGTIQLTDATGQLSDGLTKLTDGISQFQSGLVTYDNKISAAESQIAQGADTLCLNLSKLNSKLSSSVNKDDVTALVAGTQKASSAVKTANSTIADMNALKQKILTDTNLGQSDKTAILTALGTIQALNSETSGLPKIAEGTSKLASITDVVDAVGSLSSGAAQLSSGISNANKQSSAGRQSLITEGIKPLSDGANDIKNGADQLDKGMNEFQVQSETGRNALINGTRNLNEGSKELYNGISQFKAQGSQARKTILDGVDKLYLGTGTFLNGLCEFDTKTADGVKKLADGANSIYDGECKAADGVRRIKNEGTTELKDGTSKLYEGTTTLSNGLKDGYEEMDSGLKTTPEEMAGFLSDPVALERKPMYELPNYGTGFTPYFLPLSLWVGALLMFLMVPMEVNKKYKNSPVSIVFGKYGLMLTVGTLQAIISCLVVLFGLKLQVQSIPLFIGFNILTSAAFIAIIQCLVYIFGEDVGRFFGLVLLMLQLTSCGGTFPMELVPKFFNSLHAWLPMTYAISGLREIISGADYSVLNKDIMILSALMVVFLVISIWLKSRVEKIKNKILRFRVASEDVA